MSSGAALKKELNAARRDWDAALLDTLVEIVIAAKSRDDIDDVLANFVGDDPAVLQVIDRYFASQPGAGSGLRLLTRGNDPLEAKYAAAAGPGGGVGQRVGVADNGKVLGLFKEGGKIRSKAGKGGKGGEGAGGIQLAQLERKVVNCLGCGKIFDCRQLSCEVTRFLGGSQRLCFPMVVPYTLVLYKANSLP
ncbi:Fe2OG dioxygenase domain-containing protein [Haematococcus lacustris]|uniref:Fe2OG dioxygenase domain-containing protein n=1 Tax=Haematococcus lacustris TaxID=44745 RepID=A0A699ZKL4_HAELA|nr:Fe2OG dioxygenase domain-containing protein [Haematococcus lacustris]